MSWNKEVLIRGTGAENEKGERGKMNRIESNNLFNVEALRIEKWEQNKELE